MTVSTTAVSVSYAGNGVTVAFPIPFSFGAAADLAVVLVDDATGAETTQALTTHYTVVQSANGTGTLTMLAAPATGKTLLIGRETVLTQPDSLRNQGAYYPETVEKMFDRNTRQLQEVEEVTERALRVPFGATADAALPTPVPGGVPMVKADGTGFAWALWGTNPDALASLSAPGGAGLIGFNDTLGTKYLKTVSDIINGSRVSLQRFIDPTKLAAIRAGTSTYDASADIQDGLDAAAALVPNGLQLYVPHGVYLARNLRMSGNTSLEGDPASTVFKLLPGALDTDILLGNANPGAYTDFNISVRGMTFNGNDAGAGATQTRLSELLSFGRVLNLMWTYNIVTNVQYTGLALAGVRRARITNSQFAECGFAGATSNGGPAVWVATMGTDYPEDVVFSANEVHDNRWSGLHLSVSRGVVSGNAFYNNQEAHLFGSWLESAGILMNDVAITGNSFRRVRRHDISSHAIEVGGRRLTITGNTIYDCDHGGIALTDPQYSTVSGNTIGNFNNLAHTLGGGVDLICSAAGPDAATGVTITGNTIFDDRATVLGRAGVYVHNAGGDAPTGLTIENNPMRAAWTSGKGVLVGAGMLGAGFTCRDNPGNDDTARGCTVSLAAPQSLPNSTTSSTPIAFDTVSTINSKSFVEGEGPMWEAATPTRITAREPGRWKVTGGIGFTGNATGTREVSLTRNGSPASAGLARQLAASASALYTAQLNIASAVIDVVAGDYIELQARQDSGGNLNAESGLPRTWLSVEVL